MAFDDPRLPTAPAGAEPLRLNTEPLPLNAMPEAPADHAARVAIAVGCLVSLCGDYAPLRRRFVATYFSFVIAELETHRAALAAELTRFDGLYGPDDWLWSALRPLPRAWLNGPNGPLPADIAFWDGERALVVELSARDTPRQAALREAGVSVLRIPPDVLTNPTALGGLLPAAFHVFWRGQVLPASPFRRPVPRGVLGAPTA